MSDSFETTLKAEIRRLDSRDDDIQRQMGEGFTGITRSLEQLRQSVSRAQTPNYTALGLVLTFVTVAGTALWWPINQRLTAMEHHAEKDGHPETVIMRIAMLEAVGREREETQRYYAEKLATANTRAQAAIDAWQTERIDSIDYYGSARWRADSDAPSAVHPGTRSGEKRP